MTNLTSDEYKERTHGFAPMDNLSDVCGAYTSDGYCWRPRKHPIHGTKTGMGLYQCDTPAQVFNAERERMVAENAATRMRDKCVETVRAMRDQHNRDYGYWRSIASNPDTDFGVLKFAAWAGEDERVITELESLTLDQVEQ